MDTVQHAFAPKRHMVSHLNAFPYMSGVQALAGVHLVHWNAFNAIFALIIEWTLRVVSMHFVLLFEPLEWINQAGGPFALP